jgi:hypothetical protein
VGESQNRQRARLLKSSASSATRILEARAALAGVVADSATRNGLKGVARPNSLSRTLRKAGVALILAPDPVTAVPGAIMLGASLATRGKEPLRPASVYDETRKLLEEMGSSI